jgi:hypothetical protein
LGDSGGLAAVRILLSDTSRLARAEAAAGVGQNYCQQVVDKQLDHSCNHEHKNATDSLRFLRRLFRKAVQQGRSE